MFICDHCHQNSAPGESAVRVVLKRREKVYMPRAKVNRLDKIQGKRPDDLGGKGHEVVEEALMHEGCAALVKATSA